MNGAKSDRGRVYRKQMWERVRKLREENPDEPQA